MAPSSIVSFNPRAVSNYTTCSTSECVKTAQSILDDIDLNVDPCSDFYQYTCGSWLNKAVIPEDRSYIGKLERADNSNAELLRTILEGTYEDAYKDLLSTDEGFHREEEAAIDKENFDTMQSYYNLCLDSQRIDSLGPTPIYENIANIENVLFPVKDAEEVFTSNATPALSKVLAFFSKNGIGSLNSIYIDADDKNPSMNAILFDQVSLGLPSKEYYEDADTLKKYQAGLNDVLYKVLGDYSNGTEDAAFRAKESQRNSFTLWSKEKIAAAVDRYIAFETQLANISIKNEDLQDPVKLYNPTSVSEFQSRNSLIDWTSLLSSILPIDINTVSTIIDRTPEYYQRLQELLSSRQVTLQTLQEYFVVLYVSEHIYSLDSTSRAAQRKMEGDISSGTSTEQPRWRQCVGYTSSTFSDSLGRYYTLKKFGSENERKKAEAFLVSIHKAWLDRLPNIEWLDDQTRAKAVEKVNLIKHKVGYSIISPDIRKPSSIKAYYDGAHVNTTSFFDTQLSIGLWSINKMWQKTGKEVDKDEWFMSPQTVNAYYAPNVNEIAIPAGILQAPFYDASFLQSLNFGGIGMVIGHEITHAFDSSGRKYDGEGHLTDWWTNETSAKFEESTNCFIDQYSKFNVTGPDNKPVFVNGKLTLGENLADNGGVSASLAAYQALVASEPDQVLPGLEQLSPEALFFINFGRTWCTKERPQSALGSILTDPHSPPNARVNGVVQNSEAFAKTFNCPAGSPMNPVKKCTIW